MGIDVEGEIDAAAWACLEREVVERIRALAAVSSKLDAPEELRKKIHNDLILPNVRLLAQFCLSVEFDEQAIKRSEERHERVCERRRANDTADGARRSRNRT